MDFELHPIGTVESPLTDPATAPKQGDEVLVLTWFHRADREVLRVHPRGDDSRAPQGVFATRSPHRPNPIGLHRVRILALDGARVKVSELEAVNGTPVVDLKPVLSANASER